MDPTEADLDRLEAELLGQLYTRCREDLYTFVRYMAPMVLGEEFKDGAHIRLMCEKLQHVEATPGARLMVTLPPRSMKSVLVNILFAAWCFGRNPGWQIISWSHTIEFAAEFGREVRDLIKHEEYAAIFPATVVDPNNRNALRWGTTRRGRYKAAGAGTSLAGKGANVAIADDLLSEKTAYSKVEKEKIKKKWGPGFRSRLQPGGRIVVVSTRYGQDDVIGWLLDLSKQGGVDKWEVINIPAISVVDGEERSYWPERWPLKLLQDTRADPTMPPSKWNALYQGNPTPEEGVVVSKDDFNVWDMKRPLPKFVAKIITADTAFGDKETNDYSVLQVWGIFTEQFTDSRGREFTVPNVILLACRKGRWKYPDLLNQTRELIKKYSPDRVVVENKASGQVLIPDLHLSGVPVVPYTPGRGQDKMSRLQAVLRFITSKRVYIPDLKYAHEMVEEICSFPFGAHDDQVDAFTLALIFLRDNHALYAQDQVQHDPDEGMNYYRKPRATYWRVDKKRPAA